MKRIAFFFLTLAFASAAVSCNDTDVDQAHHTSFVTVHQTLSVEGYYFETDNGKTIFPGDTSRIGAYQATEGQRALIAFNLLDNMPGYDYNAAIYGIGHISSADVCVVTDEAELIAMKNDPIIEIDGRLLGDWITVVIRHQANTTDALKHEFAMFLNEVVPSTDEEKEDSYEIPTTEDPEVLTLQLRHKNLEETVQGYFYDRYYSFNVEEIVNRFEGKKKIEVCYYDGTEWKTVELRWLKESDPETL